WLEVLHDKLVELKVLAPKHNHYSKEPQSRKCTKLASRPLPPIPTSAEAADSTSASADGSPPPQLPPPRTSAADHRNAPPPLRPARPTTHHHHHSQASSTSDPNSGTPIARARAQAALHVGHPRLPTRNSPGRITPARASPALPQNRSYEVITNSSSLTRRPVP